jgi:lipopolysaccharide/colanic/teichoic acid biosynthesis glycosyltransferase
MRASQRFTKRAFDIAASLIGLIVFALPFVLVGVVVKLSSNGPVFFVQNRVGRHGKLFSCLKFRTMFVGSETYGTVTTARDTRITPIGRFLRRYKLDEFPQLWNVLTGKMSFVGPRPDVPGYADRLTGDAQRILELRPGITGPATVHFRGEEELLSTVADPRKYNDEVIWPTKVALNLAYIDNWSFWADICCILKTFFPPLLGPKT